MTADLSTPPSLAFTGERFTPEVRGEIWHEHWHRYALALPLARGRRVLDAACGEGYGSALLATVAASVVGVDVSADVVAHAQARYAGSGRELGFVRASCASLPLPDASFDLVVSFETIEHLAEQEAMLAELRRVLAPQGVLLISSPNSRVYGAQHVGHNEFHVRELSREELAALLAPGFPRQRWYGQSILARSVVWADDEARESVALPALDRDGHAYDARDPAPATYFLVVAGGPAADLPRLPGLSLFGDPGGALLDSFQRATEIADHLEFVAATLYWDREDARRIAAERQARLVEAVNGLSSERQVSAALAGRIEGLERELARTQGECLALADRLQRLSRVPAFLRPLAQWLRSRART